MSTIEKKYSKASIFFLIAMALYLYSPLTALPSMYGMVGDTAIQIKLGLDGIADGHMILDEIYSWHPDLTFTSHESLWYMILGFMYKSLGLWGVVIVGTLFIFGTVALILKNIVKEYVAGDSTVTALKGVSVDFREHEFVSILGPSGCGKTTLLNIIGGLDQYTSGDLVISGKSTRDFRDADWDTYRNHSIGFVFQSYNLIPHQSVLSNVELALTLSGVSGAERRKRAGRIRLLPGKKAARAIPVRWIYEH